MENLNLNNIQTIGKENIAEMTGFDEKTFEEIVQLQDSFNARVIGQDWKEKDNNWKMAIILENAELLDSFDWKWWKHTPIDWQNIEIEMVDLFHFLIALGLKESNTKAFNGFFIANELRFKEQETYNDETMQEVVIGKMLNDFNSAIINGLTLNAVSIFIEMWFTLGNNSDDLFRKYKMKYTLNQFRQDNGYKDGSYIKIWEEGKEDNVFAQELQKDIPNDDKYLGELHLALSKKYFEITSKAESKEENSLVSFIKNNDQYTSLIESVPNDVQKVIFEMLETYKEY